MPPKIGESTTSDARSKPSIAYELIVPELKPLGSYVVFLDVFGSWPHLTFLRFLTIKMVDVFVGAKRKTFRLHEDLLCDRSDYFKATFIGEFAEAKSKELYLPEDNDASFELFVNWLYGGNIKPPSKDDELQAYFGLLALAEKTLIEHLGNLATDHIRAYYRNSKARVSARDLSFVFEDTMGHHMQRSMALVAAMQTLNSNSNKDLPADLRELVLKGGEVAAAFAKYLLFSQDGGKTSRIDEILDFNQSCTFHYHNHTPKCKGPAIRKLVILRGAVLKN
ncbi:MAG: hypothetical protein Q9175_005086 [Cornicularia normoerica]